jgi:hypothetical protein
VAAGALRFPDQRQALPIPPDAINDGSQDVLDSGPANEETVQDQNLGNQTNDAFPVLLSSVSTSDLGDSPMMETYGYEQQFTIPDIASTQDNQFSIQESDPPATLNHEMTFQMLGSPICPDQQDFNIHFDHDHNHSHTHRHHHQRHQSLDGTLEGLGQESVKRHREIHYLTGHEVRQEARQQHSPQISTANSTRPQPSVLGTLCTRSTSPSRTCALPVQTFVSPEATRLVRPPLARTAYPTSGSDKWASNFQPSSPIAIGSPHSTAHQARRGCIARPESTSVSPQQTAILRGHASGSSAHPRFSYTTAILSPLLDPASLSGVTSLGQSPRPAANNYTISKWLHLPLQHTSHG